MGLARTKHARCLLVLKLIAVFLLLAFSLLLPAQTQTPQRRKVALALSGGSALGLSHIGVLKYFEEHHIPVDYVAGTSMGGLVGGFYATGVSPGDIEKIAA